MLVLLAGQLSRRPSILSPAGEMTSQPPANWFSPLPFTSGCRELDCSEAANVAGQVIGHAMCAAASHW